VGRGKIEGLASSPRVVGRCAYLSVVPIAYDTHIEGGRRYDVKKQSLRGQKD
jgi:hypothetical protein